MLVARTLVARRPTSAISVDLCGGRGLLLCRAVPQCSHSRVGVRRCMRVLFFRRRDPVASTWLVIGASLKSQVTQGIARGATTDDSVLCAVYGRIRDARGELTAQGGHESG